MRDLDIFKTIQCWLQQPESVWLCTVLETWGSSPRPRGSLLACNARGEFIGSLSGGCVEEDLIARIVKASFLRLFPGFVMARKLKIQSVSACPAEAFWM
ncbi:MAG: XdhC family protein [Cellvibrionales bacterium]|nr:XdhC family protein [Cellvibrionales bacterium]